MNQQQWKYPNFAGITQKTKFYADGLVRDLPSTMLNDQYGVAAFVVGQKATANFDASHLPDTIAKEVMTELENEVEQKAHSPCDPWFACFSGPLTKPLEPAVFAAEAEVPLPSYLCTSRKFAENPAVNVETIRKSLDLKMDKFGDDLLFFLFYSFPQDILQLFSAQQLYQNGWRYHMEAQLWLRRNPMLAYEKEFDVNGVLKERGVYEYFDNNGWKIERRECIIDYSKLEGPPQPPAFPATTDRLMSNGMSGAT